MYYRALALILHNFHTSAYRQTKIKQLYLYSKFNKPKRKVQIEISKVHKKPKIKL